MLLYARALGQGVSFLLTKLLIEHVKIRGDDPEACMVNTRAMLDRSLSRFRGEVRTHDGGDMEITDEIRARIGLILDAVEREAREALSLAPPAKDRH